jgi:hypothetical protein
LRTSAIVHTVLHLIRLYINNISINSDLSLRVCCLLEIMSWWHSIIDFITTNYGCLVDLDLGRPNYLISNSLFHDVHF